MILVDTSVWIDFLRYGDPELSAALENGRVVMHPFIIGELACGNLRSRSKVLGLLGQLPTVPVCTPKEVLHFIDHHDLSGIGLGYIDAHLLAAAKLSGYARIRTLDRSLQAAAKRLKIAG